MTIETILQYFTLATLVRIGTILGVLLIGHIVLSVFSKILSNFLHRQAGHTHGTSTQITSLVSLVIVAGRVFVWGVAVIMMFDLIGVNVTSLIAGAGVVGLAIGFGAQALTRDFVSGILLLIEKQYVIGDRVRINDSEGIVRRITLRTTIIEDETGALHYITHGAVGKVINLSTARSEASKA